MAFCIIVNYSVYGQGNPIEENQKKEIHSLIDTYLKARENKNEDLLRSILNTDVDQLVSSGEWRIGIEECVDGMMRSSTNNPGKRSIVVDKIKLLNPEAGIADAKYEIVNANGSVRRMWSTFILVLKHDKWLIAGIRNMRYDGS
jgi:superfamily I DNA and/or RNA helicase